jgi:uncharacterized protein with von Willebrand factor type A (vWA) domain
MKIPKVGDINSRVNSSLPNIRKYDGNPINKKNNMTGWSAEVKDDSWEAGEERRSEEESRRLEDEKIMQEKQQRKLVKEQELEVERKKLSRAKNERDLAKEPFRTGSHTFQFYPGSPYYPEYVRKENEFQKIEKQVRQLELNLQKGEY